MASFQHQPLISFKWACQFKFQIFHFIFKKKQPVMWKHHRASIFLIYTAAHTQSSSSFFFYRFISLHCRESEVLKEKNIRKGSCYFLLSSSLKKKIGRRTRQRRTSFQEENRGGRCVRFTRGQSAGAARSSSTSIFTGGGLIRINTIWFHFYIGMDVRVAKKE